MRRYVLRRVLEMVPLVLVITAISFALIRAVPGGPLSAFELDPSIKPEDVERIRRNLGLDRPLYEQYLVWLWGLLHGDLGRSLITGRDIAQMIAARVPNTLLLAVLALAIQYAAAIPIGVYAALHHRRAFDQISNLYAAVVHAVPGFWLGILLILVFSVQFQSWGLPWLPSGGMYTIATQGALDDRLVHLILPTAALAIPGMAALIRYTRSAMLEQLGQDYVRTARAKGLRRHAVTLHAFRNSLLPIVTLLGLNLPLLFSGALVVEVIFQWPGMGQLAYTAATQRDYTVLMALVVVSSVLVVVGNLLADVVYGLLDPRVGYS
jgi:peptide/nickel transport system permease protein